MASPDYAQTEARLIGVLNQFLTKHSSELKSIALYCPIQNEIDLRPTLLDWAKAQAHRQLALPYAKEDKHLDFYLWQAGDVLSPSKHGVPEPIPSNSQRPQILPDCILLPCVGWSESQDKKKHWRLGYGGGYFDRTLALLKKLGRQPICIGIGFDWQKLDDTKWSAQTHDEPLTYMLTESGLRP
ncbi:5-formyltetrahydrofolate cyclo-ligase [Polynucleobacter sp. MWH-P3-07-1]|uniref:5-formyltetrahydrofolate cyclo-ligase n=1 Tax=Polynucleobacter sp. MWH-P3-07-1 TaxID=1743173 RepID=UPI00203EEFDA|nr:5-formyltetrahydrofolate cyclo-ligase [Polynucleobacter sp. MWH-P3-07-1]